MNKKVYIKGNVVVEKGLFYARNVVSHTRALSLNEMEIEYPHDGLLNITEDYGSIFTSYYVEGEVSCRGLKDGNIIAFQENYASVYDKYKRNIESVSRLINESTIPNDLKNLFYQQQYISVFGAMELFLFNTLMWRTCNDYDSYVKVISENLIKMTSREAEQNILNGEDCLNKEKQFIKKVQKIIYHQQNSVDALYTTAFGQKAGLIKLKEETATRHDLVHRMGYTYRGSCVEITKVHVENLIEKVDEIVKGIITVINASPLHDDGRG